MAKLIYVPLGCSLRSQLAEKLSQQPLGEGVLVLPNRLLTIMLMWKQWAWILWQAS